MGCHPPVCGPRHVRRWWNHGSLDPSVQLNDRLGPTKRMRTALGESGVGALGGIHDDLLAAAHELALVLGCDMLFLNPGVLAWLVDVADGVGLVVFRHELGMEPLHAEYRKSCLPAVEGADRSGERCASAFHDQVRVRYMNPARILSLGPGLGSFYNVKTPDPWREALAQIRASDAATEARSSASIMASP